MSLTGNLLGAALWAVVDNMSGDDSIMDWALEGFISSWVSDSVTDSSWDSILWLVTGLWVWFIVDKILDDNDSLSD